MIVSKEKAVYTRQQMKQLFDYLYNRSHDTCKEYIDMGCCSDSLSRMAVWIQENAYDFGRVMKTLKAKNENGPERGYYIRPFVFPLISIPLMMWKTKLYRVMCKGRLAIGE